jgi:glycerate kinase
MTPPVVLVAPDKFKGSLSAEVAAAIADGVSQGLDARVDAARLLRIVARSAADAVWNSLGVQHTQQ